MENEIIMKNKIIEWFALGERGMSSEAMAAAASGVNGRARHPSDPADFNRCLLLLIAVPEVREKFDKIAALSDTWNTLIEHWDEVEECFINEVGLNWSKGRKLHASKTYDLMKSLGC